MKKFLRYIAVAALMVSAVAALNAQGLREFRDRLMLPNPFNHARITVSERGDAGRQISSLAAAKLSADTLVRGYRVTIFFDNSQAAREEAERAQRQFKEAFPDVPVYWSYVAPDFKVSVGDCLTNEEAIILQGRVERLFPRAFIIRENIPLRVFAESPLPHISVQSGDN